MGFEENSWERKRIFERDIRGCGTQRKQEDVSIS
jgi:hypothetical protein